MLRLEKNGILQWATAKEGLVSSDRKVTAYTSDDKGNKVNTASEYSTIEMYVSPNDGFHLFIVHQLVLIAGVILIDYI